MNIRQALITQSPSLALQRAASELIAQQDALIKEIIVKYFNNSIPPEEFESWLLSKGEALQPI